MLFICIGIAEIVIGLAFSLVQITTGGMVGGISTLVSSVFGGVVLISYGITRGRVSDLERKLSADWFKRMELKEEAREYISSNPPSEEAYGRRFAVLAKAFAMQSRLELDNNRKSSEIAEYLESEIKKEGGYYDTLHKGYVSSADGEAYVWESILSLKEYCRLHDIQPGAVH